MSKYKIQKTDILHNGKLYPAGSEIELQDKDAEKLADYLIPIKEKKANPPKTTPEETEGGEN